MVRIKGIIDLKLMSITYSQTLTISFAFMKSQKQGDFVELDNEPDAAKQGRLLNGEGNGTFVETFFR